MPLLWIVNENKVIKRRTIINFIRFLLFDIFRLLKYRKIRKSDRKKKIVTKPLKEIVCVVHTRKLGELIKKIDKYNEKFIFLKISNIKSVHNKKIIIERIIGNIVNNNSKSQPQIVHNDANKIWPPGA